MTLTFELSNEQIQEIADVVAAKLKGLTATKTYTVSQAAKVLGVSNETIRRRIRAGLIETVPNMGVVRITAATMARILGENPS